MAPKIRLRRMGRKKAPTYRIVVAESSMPRDGRFVANLGHYNPRTNPVVLVVDRDEALQWISKGATPTDTAKSLLRQAGVFKPESQIVEAVEAVKETVTSTAKKAAGAAKSAASKASETVTDAAESVSAAAGTAAEKVGDAAGTVREKAADAAETVRGKAGDAAEAVKERVAGDETEAPAAEDDAAKA